jgi:hypothetical protein
VESRLGDFPLLLEHLVLLELLSVRVYQLDLLEEFLLVPVFLSLVGVRAIFVVHLSILLFVHVLVCFIPGMQHLLQVLTLKTN